MGSLIEAARPLIVVAINSLARTAAFPVRLLMPTMLLNEVRAISTVYSGLRRGPEAEVSLVHEDPIRLRDQVVPFTGSLHMVTIGCLQI